MNTTKVLLWYLLLLTVAPVLMRVAVEWMWWAFNTPLIALGFYVGAMLALTGLAIVVIGHLKETQRSSSQADDQMKKEQP